MQLVDLLRDVRASSLGRQYLNGDINDKPVIQRAEEGMIYAEGTKRVGKILISWALGTK